MWLSNLAWGWLSFLLTVDVLFQFLPLRYFGQLRGQGWCILFKATESSKSQGSFRWQVRSWWNFILPQKSSTCSSWTVRVSIAWGLGPSVWVPRGTFVVSLVRLLMVKVGCLELFTMTMKHPWVNLPPKISYINVGKFTVHGCYGI